jgi:hypothetical protein
MSARKQDLGLMLAWAGMAVLLGLSGAYLVSRWYSSRQEGDRLAQADQEIRKLWIGRTSPTTGNLEQVTAEVQRLRELLAQGQSLLQPTPVEQRSEQEFKLLLAKTVAEMNQAAAAARAGISANYAFSFEAETKVFSYSPPSIPLLSAQLREVQSLCDSLFRARIRNLIRIRRIATSEHDLKGAPDLLGDTNLVKRLVLPGNLCEPPRTNALPVEIWPYEITLECPGPSVAAVLNELSGPRQFRVIRTLSVEPVAPVADGEPRGTPAWGKPPKPVPPPKEDQLRVKLLIQIVRPTR